MLTEVNVCEKNSPVSVKYQKKMHAKENWFLFSASRCSFYVSKLFHRTMKTCSCCFSLILKSARFWRRWAVRWRLQASTRRRRARRRRSWCFVTPTSGSTPAPTRSSRIPRRAPSRCTSPPPRATSASSSTFHHHHRRRLIIRRFVYLLPCIPSVLWRCWLGGRKGIRPVENWVVRRWRGYLSGTRCRLAYGPADATATHYLLLQ